MTKQHSCLKFLSLIVTTAFALILTGCSGSTIYDCGNVTVSTIAGGAEGYVDATGTAASFYYVTGIVSDGVNLYVADTGNNVIRTINITSGAVTTLTGTAGAGYQDGILTAAKFSRPQGLVLHGQKLYVADSANNAIRQIDLTSGQVSTLAGLPTGTPGFTNAQGTSASFNYPVGLALSADGTILYVADDLNNAIRRIDITSQAVTTIIGLGPASSSSSDGPVTSASTFNPKNLAADINNLYFTDSGYKIRQLNFLSGQVTTLAGTGESGFADGPGNSAKFYDATQIVTDGTNLYVADTLEIRKVVISTGVVDTIAGAAIPNQSVVDGKGPAARFGAAYGLAIDATNSDGFNLYITDLDKVRKLNYLNNVCPQNNVAVGGSVSGLTGTVNLNAGSAGSVSVSQNGVYTFTNAVPPGTSYSVSISQNPANQTCTIANSSGVANAAVSNINVTCVNASETIGGTLSGLAGPIVLQNNLANNQTFSMNGAYTFNNTVSVGGAYSVSVLTPPAGQTCSVSNASGNANANITNANVTCSTITYTIGGTIMGLSGAVVLQDNGGDNLSQSSNGTFQFASPIPSGGTYVVSVLTQPVGQTCTVTTGSGTASANVTNVSVNCVSSGPTTYTIGGTVTNLSSPGLVLQNNGGDNYPVFPGFPTPSNVPFTFATPIASGNNYSVTVLSNPSGGQTCTVTSGGSGTANAPVSNVVVHCSP